MVFYFVLFFLIVFAGIINNFNSDFHPTVRSRVWYYFIMFLLMGVAAFRAEGVDNDMGNYLTAITDGWGITEASFYLISYFGYNILGSLRLVFLIFAVLAIGLRFSAYRKLSPHLFMTIMVYYSTFFVVHEMNQIRAAVAVGFFLWGLYYWLLPERKILVAIFMFVLSISFHYSFILPCLFICFVKNLIRGIYVYIALIPLAYILYFTKVTPLFLLSKLGGGYIADKVSVYQEFGMGVVTQVNVFSILVLLKCLIVGLLIAFRNQLAQKHEHFYFYLKFYIIGLFFLIFFSSLPGAAFRIAEMFWVVEPLLIPLLISIFRPRYLSVFLLVVLCTYWVWLNYVASNFLRPYQFDFSL